MDSMNDYYIFIYGNIPLLSTDIQGVYIRGMTEDDGYSTTCTVTIFNNNNFKKLKIKA